jgi:hypothetical protein
MQEWVFIWFTDESQGHMASTGILFYTDKTWAIRIPRILLQYVNTPWMFSDMTVFLGLVAVMTALQSAANALAKDDREAFDREFQLRVCLKSNLHAPGMDLGLLSAQVSWLSSCLSRHRHRLAVVGSPCRTDQRSDKYQARRTLHHRLHTAVQSPRATIDPVKDNRTQGQFRGRVGYDCNGDEDSGWAASFSA